jgi:Sterol carrier protein domain
MNCSATAAITCVAARTGRRAPATNQSPDFSLGVADLGAISLGGVRLLRIARAGRVCGDDLALLRRLDHALIADREHAHGTAF